MPKVRKSAETKQTAFCQQWCSNIYILCSKLWNIKQQYRINWHVYILPAFGFWQCLGLTHSIQNYNSEFFWTFLLWFNCIQRCVTVDSTEVKFSQHAIVHIPRAAFRNNLTAGALIYLLLKLTICSLSLWLKSCKYYWVTLTICVLC